jgi:hypothetical protein
MSSSSHRDDTASLSLVRMTIRLGDYRPSTTTRSAHYNLLAIAAARPEIHGLALEVFYQENSFVLGPFLTMEDQPDLYLYHLGHWKHSIGWRACSYLRENVFEG